jgi:uncharacterized protein YbdZ (MbtH family)
MEVWFAMRDEEIDDRVYKVVVNHEAQYSVWFADRENPAGWGDCGKTGKKQECLAFIGEIWTDMRPLSLVKRMAELERNPPPPAPAPPPVPRHPLGMNDLVERLQEPQPVEAGLRPERVVKYLKDQVDRGFVFMKFMKTGTELGIRLDRDACDLTGADFEAAKGNARFVGDLTLNYNKVRYHGDLDLASLSGTGRLEFIKEVKPGEI